MSATGRALLPRQRVCQAQPYAVRIELVCSAERGPEDTAVTVSVTPTIFRAEITGSKGLVVTRGAPPVCRPALTIHDQARRSRAEPEKELRDTTGTKSFGGNTRTH